jgi:hypothetical protein
MTEHTTGESRYRILMMGLALACFAPASPSQSIPDAGTRYGERCSAFGQAHLRHHSEFSNFAHVGQLRTDFATREVSNCIPRCFRPGNLLSLSAAFAGESQLSNGNRSFGRGAEGYSRYLGGAYADFVIGDYLTEGIFPVILHQDPRYFRRGKGSGWSRLGYSIGQIFWTHCDSGRTEFNYSEVVGNSAAVAISNIYYRDNRTAHDAVSLLAVQLGVDMATNVLKEFWQDVDRKFRPKHSIDADSLSRH